MNLPADRAPAAPTPASPATADGACVSDCPVRRCAQLIEGKWTTQIVRDLLPGRRRYCELLAGLPGISPKVLAERLRLLERHGVLTRQVYAEVPPRTEYELTALGQQLQAVIAAMASFGLLLAENSPRVSPVGVDSSSDGGHVTSSAAPTSTSRAAAPVPPKGLGLQNTA